MYVVLYLAWQENDTKIIFNQRALLSNLLFTLLKLLLCQKSMTSIYQYYIAGIECWNKNRLDGVSERMPDRSH